jgi:hypothetical protein
MINFALSRKNYAQETAPLPGVSVTCKNTGGPHAHGDVARHGRHGEPEPGASKQMTAARPEHTKPRRAVRE